MQNSRFTVATHILSILGMYDRFHPGVPVKSHQIAGSVNTNPVIIRRILATLRNAGLVQILGGASGGSLINRKAEAITLREVHKAIDDNEVFAMHTNTPSKTCPVGATIKPILGDLFNKVDQAIDAVLEEKTIGDLVEEIEESYSELKAGKSMEAPMNN